MTTAASDFTALVWSTQFCPKPSGIVPMLNPSIDVRSRSIHLQCLCSAAALLCLTDEPLRRSIKASYGSQSLDEWSHMLSTVLYSTIHNSHCNGKTEAKSRWDGFMGTKITLLYSQGAIIDPTVWRRMQSIHHLIYTLCFFWLKQQGCDGLSM